jgi:tetratricopeptide (TPR) repeat protein
VPKPDPVRQSDAAGARMSGTPGAEAVARDERARAALGSGDLDTAIAEWRRLAAEFPANAEIRFRLGVALRQAGDLPGARQAYEAATAAEPRHADARNNLGNLLVELGRPAEGVRHLETAVRLRPGHVPTLCNLGGARLKAGDVAGAIRDLERATKVDPASASAAGNLGAAYREAGRNAEALEAFRRATRLDPGLVEAWSNVANALAEAREFDAALEASQRALALDPASPGALVARAHALAQLDRSEEAAALSAAALAVRPGMAEAKNGLGVALSHLGRHGEAARAFAEAVAARPNYVDAEVNRAFALIASGDWAAGFAAYEARWKRPTSPPRAFGLARWRGEALGGKGILLHTEQGLGDAVQFLRFVPEVAARGGRVAIECQPELLRLVAGIKGVATTVPRFGAPPPVACEAPLMSLPRLLGTTKERLSDAPYLAPHPEILRRFAARIAPLAQGRLKVGLVWAGNPKNGVDHRRSIAPEAFARFAALRETARFFSLQKGRQETLPAELGAVDLAPELDDLADAAGAAGALDAVVSVDTALAHLGGAIGQRTFVLLPRAADWRWAGTGESSIWYRSLRLFRQDADRPGDWNGPLDALGDALRALARK